MSRHRPTLLIPPNHRQLVMHQRRETELARWLVTAEHMHRTGALPTAVVVYYKLIHRLGPTFLAHPVGRRAAFLSGLAAYQLRIYDEAVWFLEAVRAHEPMNPDTHYNLGLMYHANRQPASAAESYRFCLALKPDYAAALNNLGNALRELGDMAGAEDCYQQLLAAEPTEPHARYNLAHVLLLRGNLARGFQLYEDRWLIDSWNAEYGRPDLTTPRLRFPAQLPTRVLVHQEQGIGDTLQFLRYAHHLVRLGFDVTFEAPVELGAWCRGLEREGLRIITRGEPIPAHDMHIPLLSIPALLGLADEAEIPPPLAPPIRRPSPLWTAPGDTRPVIGVCWAGNAQHHNDHHRTAPLSAFAPLFARPNTRFVALQIGERGVELQAARGAIALGEGSELLDLSASCTHFEATAALVAGCTAVVSVDTSIAHLGGVLGVPTYVLTSWLSEWRWQLGRTDSPWYPSVRVVRQPRLGDWPAAIAETLSLLEAP